MSPSLILSKQHTDDLVFSHGQVHTCIHQLWHNRYLMNVITHHFGSQNYQWSEV